MYSGSILRYLYFFLQYIYFIAILCRLLTCLRSVYETWCIAVLIQCCPKWDLKSENKTTKQKKCSSFHVAVHFRIVWFILHSTVFVFVVVLYWSLFPLRWCVRHTFDYYRICTVVLAVKRYKVVEVRFSVATIILYCYCEWHKVVELTCYVICYCVLVALLLLLSVKLFIANEMGRMNVPNE